MKTLKMLLCAATITCALVSCKKDLTNNQSEDLTAQSAKGNPKPSTGSAACANYVVTLERTYADGLTTFIWSVTNPNPGNGSNGTLQALSHWAFVPGCAGPNGLEQNWDDVKEAAYRSGANNPWTMIVPTPELAQDPSQGCTSANVFKFNFGTIGSSVSQYKLVLYGNYASEDNNFAVFKSGANTGCCTRSIPGVGCKVEETCSLSQGYYFAKPGPTWAGINVTVGGKTYTEAQGRAIWTCSNAGGIPASKKAFTQVAALYLSGAYPTGNSSVDADVVFLENWLLGLNKLVACSYLPNDASGMAAAAAGRIGDWINENHCD
jgi:hypothetical protein